MSHYPPYSGYKDSGVEWLGRVPTHWKVARVKELAGILNGFPFDSAKFSAVTGHPLVRIRDLGSEATEARYDGEFVQSAAITAEDVLIGMDGDFNVGRWHGKGVALLNQRMCCVRGRTRDLTRLLEYALPTPLKVINDLTYSTTVKHLSSLDVAKTPVALPPDAELGRILTILDRETVRIDGLIAKKTEFIDLLNTKRQALVTNAVTKGLNPKVKMRKSGVEWIPEVPEHWEIRRMASLFREVARPGDPSLPILSISIHDGITDDEVAPEDRDRRVTQIEDRTKYKRVAPKDLAYNMMRAWQGAFGAVTVDGLVSPAYVVAEPTEEFRTEFIEGLLRTPMAIEEMRRYSRGIADFRMRLYWDYFRDLKVCLPPLDEQEEILRTTSKEVARIDLLVEKTQHSIDLLKQRRSALITAAVTGQIDLREAA